MRICVGGTSCVGPNSQRRGCDTGRSCSKWGPWGPWGGCSVTCETGEHTRRRFCLGGNDCEGEDSQREACRVSRSCSTWGPWGPWGGCSVTCETGVHTRRRSCLGGDDCVGEGSQSETCQVSQSCSTWGPWGPWGGCSVTCETGVHTRRRSCLGGDDCGDEDTQSETCRVSQSCSTWGPWGPWGSCSVTCETGVHTRRRLCLGGDDCGGEGSQSETCQVSRSCSRWTPWGPWGACSSSCGPGTRNRQRLCSGGNDCVGQAIDRDTCSSAPCPLWGPWSPWGSCSVTCGPGTRTRDRSCSQGDCMGPTMQQTACNDGPCQVWGPWSPWSSCSVTCGSGTRTRDRSCSQGDCMGPTMQQTGCNTGRRCEVWSPWTSWSFCPCSSRQQSRTRTCQGGSGCPGRDLESRTCTPVNCAAWSPWTSWSVCSCSSRQQSRSRSCNMGSSCPGQASQSRICQPVNCQVATWGPWGPWGPCSVSCGVGQRSRSRACLGSGCPQRQQNQVDTCDTGRSCTPTVPVTPKTCGGYVRADQQQRVITSPNYPNPYPANCRCVWTITAPRGSVVILYINRYAIDCRDDSWTLRPASSRYITARVCGQSSYNLPTYYQCDNAVVVTFSSGSIGNNPRGFTMTYWASGSPKTCTQQQQLPSMNNGFTSPNFPNYYPSGVQCYQRVTAHPGMKVLLSFNPFQVRCNDYVRLQDGSYSSPNLCVPKYSSTGFSFLSHSNSMDVQFVSYGYQTWRGFKANYRQVPSYWNGPAYKLENDGESTDKEAKVFKLAQFDPLKDISATVIPEQSVELDLGLEEELGCGAPSTDNLQPWHVSLLVKGGVHCSGVVINKQWVLTSADCVMTETHTVLEAKSVVVLSGKSQEVAANGTITAGIIHSVARVIVHPHYDRRLGANNTALLWLKKQLKFSRDLAPVCLPLPGQKSQLTCRANGHMIESINATVRLTDRYECVKERPGLALTVTSGHVCAGQGDVFQEACVGLRGSAVTCQAEGRDRVYGLSVYSGAACQGKPPVYVDVASTATWLRGYYMQGYH